MLLTKLWNYGLKFTSDTQPSTWRRGVELTKGGNKSIAYCGLTITLLGGVCYPSVWAARGLNPIRVYGLPSWLRWQAGWMWLFETGR